MAAIQPPSMDVSCGLRDAMRRLASGVAVVTAIGPGGPTGMAATSITSLALDPPSLLLCVNRQASLHAYLAEASAFCVNLLSHAQRDVAAAFGGAVDRPLRFMIGDWSKDDAGVPRLDNAQANISCVVDRLIPHGTHTIVIGAVRGVHTSGPVAPLIYQDGRYL